MSDKAFNVIQHRGKVNTARLENGVQVSREVTLFVPEWGAFVATAPYDEHFIFENPDKSEGSLAYLCTCGSAAVVAPPGPRGMFVCLFHATYQQHQTSAINKKDFSKSAGETLRVKPARKWQ